MHQVLGVNFPAAAATQLYVVSWYLSSEPESRNSEKSRKLPERFSRSEKCATPKIPKNTKAKWVSLFGITIWRSRVKLL